jgi:hypothetical protein
LDYGIQSKVLAKIDADLFPAAGDDITLNLAVHFSYILPKVAIKTTSQEEDVEMVLKPPELSKNLEAVFTLEADSTDAIADGESVYVRITPVTTLFAGARGTVDARSEKNAAFDLRTEFLVKCVFSGATFACNLVEDFPKVTVTRADEGAEGKDKTTSTIRALSLNGDEFKDVLGVHKFSSGDYQKVLPKAVFEKVAFLGTSRFRITQNVEQIADVEAITGEDDDQLNENEAQQVFDAMRKLQKSADKFIFAKMFPDGMASSDGSELGVSFNGYGYDLRKAIINNDCRAFPPPEG